MPSIAGAACAIALALTVDVSGSISEREYRLQMDGLAEALRNPAVVGVGFVGGCLVIGAMVGRYTAGGFD